MARGTALAVISIGLIVLAGWCVESQILTSVVPGWVSMKANTAFCFILSGFSLLCVTARSSNTGMWHSGSRLAVLFATATIVVLCGMTEIEYIFDLNFHIDQLLFRDLLQSEIIYYPGRMSPITAFNFICVGGAFILLSKGRATYLAQAGAVLVLFLTMAVMTGVFYGLHSLHVAGRATAVALLTNLNFTLLCAGILCASGEGGIMRLLTDSGAAGMVVRRLFPAAILIPLIIGGIISYGQRAGNIGIGFGVSMFSISVIVTISILVWLCSKFLYLSERSTRLAEAGLRESLHRYAFLADTMPQMIWTASPDGRIDYCNQRWVDYTGMKMEQTKNGGWETIVHPDDFENCMWQWKQTVTTGCDYEVEYRLKRVSDGAYRWHLGRAFPFRGLSGQIIQWVGTSTDIEDQKRARRDLEKRVEDRTAHLNAILTNSLDGIIVYSSVRDDAGRLRDLRYEMINPAAEKLLGMEASELLGHGMLEKFPVVAVVGLFGKFKRIVDENIAMDFEYESLRTKPNRWYRLAGAKLGDGLLLSYTEITARKQAEQEMRNSARRLSMATQALEAGIWDWDVTTNQIFWDEKMHEIYGLPKDQSINYQLWTKTVLPEDLPKAEATLQNVIASKSQDSAEFRIKLPDGTLRHILAAEGVVLDEHGQVVRVVGVNIDVTERKELERKFLRAQRMESIGTLAGGIAHDLNNILAPIIMSIDLLKGMSVNAEATSILETIAASAKRGADVVRQVLSFARGMEGERIEVQPKHLLSELEHIIKETFPKNIRMFFSAPKDTWTISADPTQIHQILLNLCVNARDAMPNGGSLRLSVENCSLDEQYAAMNLQAKAGRYVNINVTDTGTGMVPSILEKIFEPFFTTKVLQKGTGLGLSTVMAIVRSHDGIINVYSEPGKGTTFKVYLPALDHSSGKVGELTDQASLPHGNGETILVVDDEASLLTITGQTLRANGYNVLTAVDGADAVAVYLEHKDEIAVVLTDMMMPVMDGQATIRALMKINPLIKIIAASGLHTNDAVAKLSGAGVRHFLTKPYTTEALLKAMQETLSEA